MSLPHSEDREKNDIIFRNKQLGRDMNIIYKTEKFTLIAPMTAKASEALAHPKWKNKNGKYPFYDMHDPHFIFVMQNQDRLLIRRDLWGQQQNVILIKKNRLITNKAIIKDYMEENWEDIGKALIHLYDEDDRLNLFSFIPDKAKTKEFYLEAISKYPFPFEEIPNEYLDDDFLTQIPYKAYYNHRLNRKLAENYETCLRFADLVCMSIDGIPKAYRDAQMLEHLLTLNDVKYQKYMTYRENNQEIFYGDLHSIYSLFDQFPSKFVKQYRDIVFNNFANYPDHSSFPEHIIPFLSQEQCQQALSYDPKIFHYIPENFKTLEMLNFALDHKSCYIEDIPKAFLTRESILRRK